MSNYIIYGPNKLEGEIKLQGCKNSALPILAACVMCDKEVVLHNVPKISDVQIMKEILLSLGCFIKEDENSITINSSNLTSARVSEKLVRKMRSSIIMLGALLSKQKKIQFSYPGGCDIGLRPIDLHLKGLKQLGVNVKEEHGYILLEGEKLYGNSIVLDYPSVGATENLILASVFAKGVTSIGNAAKEPEIIDLQNFLNAMGARVYGAGGNTVYVEGVEELSGCEYSIMPDRIAGGTYMCAAQMTKGEIFIKDLTLESMKSTYYKLLETGCKVKSYAQGVLVKASGEISSIDSLITLPYPGFPTDMQSQFVSMLSIANGTSIVKETIFENRFRYTSELNRMGADIKIEDRIAIIKGVNELDGANVCAKDLRGGAALTLAALRANGKSVVEDIEYIERGYENFALTLKSLNAKIVTV